MGDSDRAGGSGVKRPAERSGPVALVFGPATGRRREGGTTREPVPYCNDIHIFENQKPADDHPGGARGAAVNRPEGGQSQGRERAPIVVSL